MYTSEAIFKLEIENIFHRCWLYIGHESEIPNPGDYRLRTMGASRIMVRGHDGVYASSPIAAATAARPSAKRMRRSRSVPLRIPRLDLRDVGSAGACHGPRGLRSRFSQ